jgi:LuxR family transcriptional regulator of spore coat protein
LEDKGIENLVEPLIRRETDVLALLAERQTNKEIAHRLLISPLTVRKHASNIIQKLGVRGRREAVAAAEVIGILKT